MLDTHVALWAVVGSRRLAALVRKTIVDADEVHVSVASLWEIAIKHALGKGDMPISSSQALQAFTDAGYRFLDIRPAHAMAVERLPLLHHDPFDRLLVAQAFTEPMILMTRDERVAGYGGNIIHIG